MKSKQELESTDEQLARLHRAFVAGDRSALFEALLLAPQLKVPSPEWLADAAQDVQRGLVSGRYRSPNHAVGWTNNGKKKRVTRQRRAMLASKILAELFRYRLEGRSMTRRIYAITIAGKLGISSRDVVFVYENHGKFIKSIPQKRKDQADTYSYAEITFPAAIVAATA